MRGFLHLVLAMCAGIGFGWLSAIGMIENLGLAAVPSNPYWQERRAGSDQPLTPYAVSYFIDQGQVPPPATVRYFLRHRDDDGGFLRGDCIYVVRGKLLEARWWSMALANGQAQRQAIGAGDVILEGNGELKLALAPFPVPGTRLASPPGTQLTFSYTLHNASDDTGPITLPSIAKVEC